jgi:hypothetical protein
VITAVRQFAGSVFRRGELSIFKTHSHEWDGSGRPFFMPCSRPAQPLQCLFLVCWT